MLLYDISIRVIFAIEGRVALDRYLEPGYDTEDLYSACPQI